jgi:NTP pyrophosphatase (non-canonical NTP hydrolase)
MMMMNHQQRSLEDLNFDMTISINKEETPEGTKFTMTKQIDFDRYEKFVDAVTSDASTDFVALSDRLVELDEKGANIERLLTAGVGINAEGGEFLEIIKKMIFQGKPFNEDNREHMIIELGDLMWYVTQACMALEVPFDEVIARNVKKLEKRYPGGAFDVYYSENRAEGDL